MLVIEGCLITSDAMGCQKKICQKIVDKKADYLICVKDNQPTLCSNIENTFTQHIANHPEDPEPEENSNWICLVIEGCLITSDAMGCQKKICQKIVDKKADYLICVKDNQPTLCSNIENTFTQHIANHPEDPEPEENSNLFAETIEQGHGRHEHRRCWIFNDIAAIDPDNEWAKLTQFAVIQRDRLVKSRQTTETHCYIMSREMSAKSVLENARSHWNIENGEHWQLDVSFNEDASKVHERTATKNLATVRRCCLNAHKMSQRFPKKSMKRRVELAGLDEEYRTELIKEYSFL